MSAVFVAAKLTMVESTAISGVVLTYQSAIVALTLVVVPVNPAGAVTAP